MKALVRPLLIPFMVLSLMAISAVAQDGVVPDGEFDDGPQEAEFDDEAPEAEVDEAAAGAEGAEGLEAEVEEAAVGAEGAEGPGAEVDEAAIDTEFDDTAADTEASPASQDSQVDDAPRGIGVEKAPQDAWVDDASPVIEADDCECSYRLHNWNSRKRRAEAAPLVRKPCSQIQADERDPLEPRCSVCRKDQVTIDPAQLGIPGVKPFQICHVYREQVEDALRAIVESGEFEIKQIVGYRPGRTRGPIVNGYRTLLSNHSFGTAIDINANRNGLYTNCPPGQLERPGQGTCKLGIGGRWNPTAAPTQTITKDSIVYREFTKFWKWGGEIPGTTRDLMHFSISGY
ncbi:MAG TPA: M15 family metallopeptidase [Myxococcota bacterium]|nr:M15 family metallopeptidase [Myxococcota bacterium]